jgi:hypothetical protein
MSELAALLEESKVPRRCELDHRDGLVCRTKLMYVRELGWVCPQAHAHAEHETFRRG